MKRGAPHHTGSVLTFAAALACCRTGELKPAPRAPGNLAAAARAGVAVLAEPPKEEVAGAKKVTALRIAIDNRSNNALRLSFNEIALVGKQGEVYAALPPFRMVGTAGDLNAEAGYAPILEPGFYHQGFRVAAAYVSIYPTLPAFRGAFFGDPMYYDNYWAVLSEAAPPTTKMLLLALPEGVLEAGGRVSGIVYFEKVRADADRVELRARLVDADTGRIVGIVSLPFVVHSRLAERLTTAPARAEL